MVVSPKVIVIPSVTEPVAAVYSRPSAWRMTVCPSAVMYDDGDGRISVPLTVSSSSPDSLYMSMIDAAECAMTSFASFSSDSSRSPKGSATVPMSTAPHTSRVTLEVRNSIKRIPS
ncbi:MAG: hypothetical protein E7Z63_03280 [Thermoplasmata archaeon]|nr:hypothetical protein [Thermoplasmata archaeon]